MHFLSLTQTKSFNSRQSDFYPICCLLSLQFFIKTILAKSNYIFSIFCCILSLTKDFIDSNFYLYPDLFILTFGPSNLKLCHLLCRQGIKKEFQNLTSPKVVLVKHGASSKMNNNYGPNQNHFIICIELPFQTLITSYLPPNLC